MPIAKRKKNKCFEAYRVLIDEVDRAAEDLYGIFGNRVVCLAGCSSCCKIPRSVLPIEAEYILTHNDLDEASKQKVRKQAEKSPNCPFLVDDLCAVYPIRPLICRTHGLPLLYYFESEQGYAITHCDLNFSGENPAFGKGEYLDMETINGRLRQLNREMGFEEKRISLADMNFLHYL